MRACRPQACRGLVVAVLGVLLALVRGAHADEGFWPFNAIPRETIQRTYGFKITDDWLRHLQLASVRFPGGWGAVVWPDGLVLTNHHIALSTLSKLSTEQHDLVKSGFQAGTRAQELAAPDLELSVLQRIEDVTARVQGAVEPTMAAAEAYAARQAAMVSLEEEATERTGLKADVVSLYQGALFHLYLYKRYTDVRLVFAPEFSVGFFGGDPDNFTFPRYCLDMILFRVYENNAPVRVEHFLRVNPEGARDEELVFTAGHPYATQRLNTTAHLEYVRDVGLPYSLMWLERRHRVLERYAERSVEEARQVRDELFGVENSIKSMEGQLAGLENSVLMDRKRAAEHALRTAVERDAALRAAYGSAWSDVSRARGQLTEFMAEQSLIESGGGFASHLFSTARAIVRLVSERAKPDAERLPEFSDSRLPLIERKILSLAPIYVGVEKVKLADSLDLLASLLGAEHPVVMTVLDGRSPEARAAALVEGSRLADVSIRKALLDGGPEAIARSTDAMIVLARAIDGPARAIRKRYDDTVVSVERDAYARIAQALFAVEGTRAYPDATFSLRLSYGQVAGYRGGDGGFVRPFTTLEGLFARAAAHHGEAPYHLPQRWRDRKGRLDPTTPFNLVTTNDIVGGNSGSPVVNRRGEVVGLVFDGNIESLAGYFVYDGTVNRTVAVDIRAMLTALADVYDASQLVAEITGRVPAATAASSGR